MKVLVINGSPKGRNSNTYRLTKSFLEGLREEEGSLDLEELAVNELVVKPCLGCFSCWNKTPGKCCLCDDMTQVLEKLLWADVTIWSFPLYYFAVPGGLKNLIDRQLPLVLPFMQQAETAPGGSHPSRYDRSGQKTVVISTCGFYTAEGNYDGVVNLFDHLCGKGQYTSIFCGQGELFRVPELRGRTEAYLARVRQAGKEYAKGGILPETQEALKQLLFPREVFEEMADASWGIDQNAGEKQRESLAFTRQMAALYQKESWPGRDLVLEMYYTDKEERYQVVLGREGSKVLTDTLLKATTTVETPFSVWKAIASGELRGDEALMQHQYRVTGDFDLMLHWDEYFGGVGASQEEQKKALQEGIAGPAKKASFCCLLFPWVVFWVSAAISPFWGGLCSLAACGLSPLLFYQNRKTFFDVLSGGLVTGFSAALLLGAPVRAALPLSYLAFGVMWITTCLKKVPLTARYSMEEYGGEQAFLNPIFLKTNRILTLLWGILYLLTPIWTYVLLGTPAAGWSGALNSVFPILFGIFTAWFQKWYPAKVAGG